jgi:hypothetical protein
MTDMEIIQLAAQHNVIAITKLEWDGKRFNHTDDCLDGDAAALVMFTKAVAQHERENFCALLRQLHDSISLQSDPDGLKARGEA